MLERKIAVIIILEVLIIVIAAVFMTIQRVKLFSMGWIVFCITLLLTKRALKLTTTI